jgi:hypothetical protein
LTRERPESIGMLNTFEKKGRNVLMILTGVYTHA